MFNIRKYIQNRVKYPAWYEIQVLWWMWKVREMKNLYKDFWEDLTLISETLIYDIVRKYVDVNKTYTWPEAAREFIPKIVEFLAKCEWFVEKEKKQNELRNELNMESSFIDKLDIN